METTESVVKAIPFSFTDLWKILHIHPQFVGPQPLVRDYRLVAGLLFSRYNDGTTRVLKNHYRKRPYVEVVWHADFCDPSYHEVFVAPAVVVELFEKRLIEGTPKWGYTDEKELILSNQGSRLVVTQWFGSDLHDLIVSGASVGEDVRWG